MGEYNFKLGVKGSSISMFQLSIDKTMPYNKRSQNSSHTQQWACIARTSVSANFGLACSYIWYGRQKMVPKDIYLLIPGNCEYVTVSGKRNFINVMNLKIWDAEIVFYYLGGLF